MFALAFRCQACTVHLHPWVLHEARYSRPLRRVLLQAAGNKIAHLSTCATTSRESRRLVVHDLVHDIPVAARVRLDNIVSRFRGCIVSAARTRGRLPIPAADDWEGTQEALKNDKTKAPDVGWKRKFFTLEALGRHIQVRSHERS